MITSSYDLDTVEKAFDVALKINLTFKTLANVKARCFKCERYEHYDYQCPLESRHVRIVSNDVDDSKIVENIHIPSKAASIMKDISVSSDTLIIEEGHDCYESSSEVVDAII